MSKIYLGLFAPALFVLASCSNGGDEGSQDVDRMSDVTDPPENLIEPITRSYTLMERTTPMTRVGDTLVQSGSVIAQSPISVTGLPSSYTSFSVFYDGIGVHGASPSGAVSVIAGSTSGQLLSEMTREVDTLLPTTGEVDYSGDYVGIYRVNSADDAEYGHMYGDAEMTVDFLDQNVDGWVMNRANSGGQPADDIRFFSTGNFIEGAFDGSALNGSFTGGTTTRAGFSGMVVGETGDEIVLLFEINSELAGGDPVFEIGTVLATLDTP